MKRGTIISRGHWLDPNYRPFSPEDDHPMKVDGAIGVRNFRDQVRFTASLLSSFRPVREEMGSGWACDFERRVIFWRTTDPVPPYENLSPKQVLFLTAHEAGHLNFTGGFVTPPDWSRPKLKAFHNFWNAVEDIRIERLMGREFSGFESIRAECNGHWLEYHAHNDPKDYAAWNQVGLNWLQLEVDPDRKLGRIGTDGSIEFADALWPDISRVANAPSSNKVAQALIPIFEKLWEEQEQEKQEAGQDGRPEGNFGSGLGAGDAQPFLGSGDPFPSAPSADTYDEHPDLREHMGQGDQLQEMGESAAGGAKGRLRQAVAAEERAQDAADDQKLQVQATNAPSLGSEPGRHPDPNPRPPSDHWEKAVARVDPQIRSLAHRLRAVLDTNAMSDWSEGLRRGQLNVRRARRAVAGNNRIFRKRREIGAHDYTFGIVDDCSGSMQSKRVKDQFGSTVSVATLVLDATALVSEALEKANMPFFVVTHEHQLRGAKDVAQPLRKVAEQLGSDIALSGGGTYEAPALIVAQEQFRRVRSGHKVLFVMSDGQTNGIPESEQLVREMAREGVRTVAIGLGIDPPAHHPVRIRIEDPRELAHLLPRLINRVMRKGGG